MYDTDISIITLQTLLFVSAIIHLQMHEDAPGKAAKRAVCKYICHYKNYTSFKETIFKIYTNSVAIQLVNAIAITQISVSQASHFC